MTVAHNEGAFGALVDNRRPRGGVEEQKEEPLADPVTSAESLPKKKHQPMSSPASQRRQSPCSEFCDGTGERGVKPTLKESLESFATVVLGSCGTAVQAAAYMVQGQCRWPTDGTGNDKNVNGKFTRPSHQGQHPRPPLSIAEEIRKLNQKGHPPESGVRRFHSGPLVGPTKPHISAAGGPIVGSSPGMIDPSLGRLVATDVPKFLGEEAVQSFEDDDNVSALSQHTLEELASSDPGSGVRRKHSPREQLALYHQRHKNSLKATMLGQTNDPNREEGNEVTPSSSQMSSDPRNTPPVPTLTNSLSSSSSGPDAVNRPPLLTTLPNGSVAPTHGAH